MMDEISVSSRSNSIDDFDRAISDVGYPQKPVCIKITESSGARGVRVLVDFVSYKHIPIPIRTT